MVTSTPWGILFYFAYAAPKNQIKRICRISSKSTTTPLRIFVSSLLSKNTYQSPYELNECVDIFYGKLPFKRDRLDDCISNQMQNENIEFSIEYSCLFDCFVDFAHSYIIFSCQLLFYYFSFNPTSIASIYYHMPYTNTSTGFQGSVNLFPHCSLEYASQMTQEEIAS